MVSEFNFCHYNSKELCLGVLGPKNAETPISDHSSGQIQNMRPLIDSYFTPSTIKKWSQIFISTTDN